MPGARYDADLIIQLRGNKDLARQYVGEARKVMGFVLQDAEANGLGVHSIKRYAHDGTEIVAEKIGDLKRVRITPPNTSGRETQITAPDDFVVWARDSDNLAGIDPLFPQQILRTGEEGAWKTFFYNTETSGYNGFSGAKGTYGGLFPEGLWRAGNIDWRGPDDQMISWYGPAHRYWLEAFVQPSKQFGKFVFMLGDAVLNTDQYAASSPGQVHGPDRYILGAAIRQVGSLWYLYTVQSEAVDEDAPSSAANPSVACSTYGCIWPRKVSQAAIYRYRIRTQANAAGVLRYQVYSGSRETMAVLEDNHCEPWFFNESCTQAHAFLFPTDSWLVQRALMVTPHAPPADFVEQPLPGTSQFLREAFFDEEGAVTIIDTPISCEAAADYAIFARDYKGDTPVDALVANYTSVMLPNTRYLGMRYDVAGLHFTTAGNGEPSDNPWQTDGWDTRPFNNAGASVYFMYVDLRHDVLALLLSAGKSPSLENPSPLKYQFRVFRAGVQVHVEDLPDIQSSPLIDPLPGTASGAPMRALDARTYPPQFFLFASHCCPTSYEGIDSRYNFTGSTGGGLASAKWFVRPQAEYFGLIPPSYLGGDRIWGAGGSWIRPIASVGGGTSPDFDAHQHPMTCAVKDNVVLISCWKPSVTLTPPNTLHLTTEHSWFFVTGADFPALTGIGSVADKDSRYHPLWRLGKPPKLAA